MKAFALDEATDDGLVVEEAATRGAANLPHLFRGNSFYLTFAELRPFSAPVALMMDKPDLDTLVADELAAFWLGTVYRLGIEAFVF